jgi:hypothetical protein
MLRRRLAEIDRTIEKLQRDSAREVTTTARQ